MKRNFALLLALVFAIALSACSFTVGDTEVTIFETSDVTPTPLPPVTPTPRPEVSDPLTKADVWVPGQNRIVDYIFVDPDNSTNREAVFAACANEDDSKTEDDYIILYSIPGQGEDGVVFYCGTFWTYAQNDYQVVETAEALPTATATPAPTVTVVPAEVDVTENVTETESISSTVSLLDGMVTLTGFPEEAETVRWGFDLGRTTNDCGVPALAWLICNSGVLSFDEFNDHDENNPSAVWSGGANVDNAMSTMVEQFLNPGNGYMKTNWAGGWIRYNGIEIYMAPTDNVSFMFVSRGVYAEEGGGQTPVEYEVTDEQYRGAAKIMRYPIEDPNASGFYSWTHFNEDVEHQLTGDNCDYDGCGLVVIIATDVNRDNVTVSTYTAADGYTTIYTNSRTQ